MSRRIGAMVAGSINAQFTGGGIPYLVQVVNGDIYAIYVDTNTDASFRKSSDRGASWSDPTVLFTGSVTALSVWYDRWSNIAAGLIHVVYAESGGDDILYRSIDTESSDALSTQTTVFAGATTAAGGALSITRARGGNLVVAGSIDAGAEDGAWESDDVGATWASAIADPSEGATQDEYMLLPGWNADTQDVMLIFWDASADALSVKRYDNSGNSWAETSIATSMTDTPFSNSGPHMAAAVDISNSRNVVIAWSAVDTANADLRCWLIDDTSITEVTNVVLNSTDDQGGCAIGIDTSTGYWHVFYGGNSDGSEIWETDVNVYMKVSKDSGTTWGSETQVTLQLYNVQQIFTSPRFTGPPFVSFYNVMVAPEIICNTIAVRPRAVAHIGI